MNMKRKISGGGNFSTYISPVVALFDIITEHGFAVSTAEDDEDQLPTLNGEDENDDF